MRSVAIQGMVNHCELFEVADLDAALARLDELLPPAPRVHNAANGVHERILRYITPRLAGSDRDAGRRLYPQ